MNQSEQKSIEFIKRFLTQHKELSSQELWQGLKREFDWGYPGLSFASACELFSDLEIKGIIKETEDNPTTWKLGPQDGEMLARRILLKLHTKKDGWMQLEALAESVNESLEMVLYVVGKMTEDKLLATVEFREKPGTRITGHGVEVLYKSGPAAIMRFLKRKTTWVSYHEIAKEHLDTPGEFDLNLSYLLKSGKIVKSATGKDYRKNVWKDCFYQTHDFVAGKEAL